MDKQPGGRKSRTIERPGDADAASRSRPVRPSPEQDRSAEQIAIADYGNRGNSPRKREEGLRFLGEEAAPSDEVRDALFEALKNGLRSDDKYEKILGQVAFEAILKYLERDPGLKAEFAAPLTRFEGTPEDVWVPYVYRKGEFENAVHRYCVMPAKEKGTQAEQLSEIRKRLANLDYVPEPRFKAMIAEGIKAIERRSRELGLADFGDVAKEIEEADIPHVVKRENAEQIALGQPAPPDLSQESIARIESSPASQTTASKRKRLAHVDQVMTLRHELAAFNEKINETLEPLVASFGELLQKHDFAGCDDLKVNQATIEALNYVAARLEVGFVCPREANPKDGGDAEEIPSVLRCSTAPGAPEGVVSFEHPRADGGGRNAHGGFTAWARLALTRARKSLIG